PLFDLGPYLRVDERVLEGEIRILLRDAFADSDQEFMSGGSFSGQHPDLGVLTAITLPATGTSTAGRQRDSADSDAAELEQWAPPNGVERTVGSVEAQQF